MTKEQKIKRFNELAQLDEIHENEIIHEEAHEEIAEAVSPAPVAETPYQPTAAERAEMKAIQEQKKIRFAQLAGLQDEETPAPKLEEHDIPAKYVRPATIKISLLSEGLRKEVKRLMKSGRTKLSEFPEALRKKVMKEMHDDLDDAISQSDANDEWARKHDYDMDEYQSWKEIYGSLSTGEGGDNIYDGDIDPDMRSILYGLQKRGIIKIEKTSPYSQRVFLASPMSYEQFMELAKGHAVDDDFLRAKIDDGEYLTSKEYSQANDDLKAYYIKWKLKNRREIFPNEREDAIRFGIIPGSISESKQIKLSFLSEGLRKEVKRLMKSGRTKTSEFPEAIKKMISEEMAALGAAPMEELGMPAPSLATDSHGYPELDQFIDKLAFNVGNTITKHLGLQNEDPDFPYKANYIVDQLAHRLQNPA